MKFVSREFFGKDYGIEIFLGVFVFLDLFFFSFSLEEGRVGWVG